MKSECNTLGNQGLPMKKLMAAGYKADPPPTWRFLMQVFFSGNTAGADLGPVLRRVGGAAGEHLVDQGGHLADLGVSEMTREQGRKLIDHAPPRHVADRLERGPDEHPVVLVLAVLLVIAHLDRRRLLGVGRQRFEGPLERMLEIASDIPGPADVERAAAPVEYDARLVLMGAARIGKAIHVDVIEPVSERKLDVSLADAALQQHRAVNMNFSVHWPAPETRMLVRESRDFNPFRSWSGRGNG